MAVARRLEIILIASSTSLIDTNIVLARKELRAGGIDSFHDAGLILGPVKHTNGCIGGRHGVRVNHLQERTVTAKL